MTVPSAKDMFNVNLPTQSLEGGGRDVRTVSLKSRVPQLLVHELFHPWMISPQTFESDLILAAKSQYNEFGLVRANTQLPVCEVVSSLSDNFSA